MGVFSTPVSRWRFAPDLSGRYLLDASRVVAAGDRLLVALADTMPGSGAAAIVGYRNSVRFIPEILSGWVVFSV